MKILHIVNHTRNIGNGIVNVAVDLVCEQAKSGHQVGIISSGGEYEVLLERYGVKHFIRKEKGLKPLHHINAARYYWSVLKEFQPDIIHAHLPRETVLARILKMHFKYVLVSTVHNEFQQRSVLMGCADKVIAVSKAVAQSMARRGIPQQKLRVVCNGTLGSPRTRRLQDLQPVELQHPAIATVAGMYQRKGIAELIDAFAQIANDFPRAHLYLIGNGPDRKMFEAQAQSTSAANRIHFEGFQLEPQRYMLKCDIFILASHSEPFGLVLTEAREAGCTIIASAVDGIPEALDDGQAGILVPPKDSKTLAATLKQLLSNPNLLDTWKQRSQQNLEWFSVARVNAETLAVYKGL
jgi:glycosyltransferase involved in cell wall biosynthesis